MTESKEMITLRNVEDEMKESYLRYSMSVIISRALPDVRDGLKPSQRRILYAMRLLSLGPKSKHRKCAKICGDTSGDFHPHGEGVIYPTLARMAQDWCMRYRLVDGQGNFGSVDGDPPAAMRYTEARLTQASLHLMEDLEKDTVDLAPNYDETKTEPVVFPSKFPNLICNGSSGIAVGMATNIPPQNLGELCEATKLVIDNKDVSIEEIMEVMPGPDFPTGGLISGVRGIREAYFTGRGKLIVKALVHTEEMESSSDKMRIIIDELPYNVNKSRLIEKIADLVNNKVIQGISDLRDESDKSGMRIAIELKRGENEDVVLKQLYKFTDMRVTFGCNMLALDKGLPKTMNIKQMIAAWIEHRIEVIRRRTRFELNKAEARAHILEGYLLAIDSLDEVVKIIRKSSDRPEAKELLMQRFTFSERQVNAVLDLRLYQLTGMEKDKIQKEYDELLKKIAELKSILANELLVRDIIKNDLDSLSSLQGAKRRTQIVAADDNDFNMEDLIANDRVIITLSGDDYIKRMPIDTFREQRRGGQGVAGMDMKKETDFPKGMYSASNHDYFMIFTNSGRCYWLKVWQIPEASRRSKGKPLINLLEDLRPEEKISTTLKVASFKEEETQDCYILLATKNGVIKKTDLSAFRHLRKKGIYAINLDEGDEVIAARLVEKDQQVMLFSKGGMAVRFAQDEVRPMGRLARGVRGAKLKSEDDCLVGCEVVTGENEDESVVVVCENGYGKRSRVQDFRLTKRGGVGVRSIITSERNGSVASAMQVVDLDSVLMMSTQGQTIRIRMSDLRVMGRATQGVRLAQFKKGSSLAVVQKIEGIEGEDDEEQIDQDEQSAVEIENQAPEQTEGQVDQAEGESEDS
jgi:DNA gyrase subunit A